MNRTKSYLAAQLLGFSLITVEGSAVYAQGKQACELVTKADAESVLGVTLEQPRPYVPFRSLLDKDFIKGKMGDGCEFTNFVPGRPRPTKVISVNIEVRYSASPNSAAVEQLRKEIDERTHEHPVDVPGLGDAALWIGPANSLSLFVFTGGKVTLMVGPSQVNLEQAKALAVKALGGSRKTGYVYGTRIPLNMPLMRPGGKPNQIDQLKRDLTAKAEAGDVKAQLVLGDLYQFGDRGADGSPKPDYAGAAYWYRQASDHGEARAAYQLALLYHDGRGVPADQSASFELYRKAAQAGYVPAMVPLSFIYGDAKTPVSGQRATYWAMKAADAGDPNGWLILGYEYNKGMLGGERPFWFSQAMDAYTKAANAGNCVAMMNIGGLYFNGDGVPQDKDRAQSWFAKAEACQGKDLDWMREKAAKYRERAAAGRLPAVVASTIPPKGGAGLPDVQMLVAGFTALIAVAVAEETAHPSSKADGGGNATSGNTGTDWGAIAEHNRELEERRQYGCIMSGQKKAFGCY